MKPRLIIQDAQLIFKIMYMRTEIFSSWPGPVTWLLPVAKQCIRWVTVNSNLVAVRVSQYIAVNQLCEFFGKPLIFSSANVSGVIPVINIEQLYQQSHKTLLLVDGAMGKANKPSKIRHGISGQTIRDKKLDDHRFNSRYRKS